MGGERRSGGERGARKCVFHGRPPRPSTEAEVAGSPGTADSTAGVCCPPAPPAAKLQLLPPAAFAARQSAPTRRVRFGLSKGGGEAFSERSAAAVATPAATPVAEGW